MSNLPASQPQSDDQAVSPGSALAAAGSRQAAQRVEIESKLAALFKALDRTPRRHSIEVGEDGAEDGRRKRALMGETALSPSWRVDKAVSEIAERQAFLDRQMTGDGEAAATRRSALGMGTGLRPDADEVRRAAPPARAGVAPVPSIFTALQSDIARLAGSLKAVQLDVSHWSGVIGRSVSVDDMRAVLAEAKPDPSLAALGASVEKLTARLDAYGAVEDQTVAIERLSSRIEEVHGELSQQLAVAGSGVDTAAVERLVAEVVARGPALRSTAPDLHGLEAAVQDLAAKLAAAEKSDGDERLLLDMQAQVTRLAERIDRTDAGLTAIVAMERSLGDIFRQVDEMKEVAVSAAAAAGRSAAEETMRAVLPLDTAERRASEGGQTVVEEMSRGLAELKADREQADQRLHSLLAALNGSLERVVDRLDALESDAVEPRTMGAFEPPEAAPPVVAFERAPVPEPVAIAAPEPLVVEPSPLGPTSAVTWTASPSSSAFELGQPLDLDLPIEPGAARAGVASELAAASPTVPDPTTFIAAARRAAQNAARDQSLRAEVDAPASDKIVQGERSTDLKSRFRIGMLTRRRPLLLALAGLLVLAGAAQIARMSLLDPSASFGTSDDRTGTTPPPPAPASQDRSEVSPADAPAGREAVAAVRPEAPPTPSNSAAAAAPDGAYATASATVDPGAVAPGGAATSRALPTMAMGPLASVAALKAADASAQLNAMAGIPLGLQELADGGRPDAQFEVALRYADGRKVARNMKTAATWFEKAAAQGLAPAAYRLGSLYEKGLGVARDAGKSMSWYRTAAEAGNVRAMHNLAVMLAEGAGGKADYPQAVSWFTKAAEAGVRDSQYNLGILYARGLGVTVDLGQSYTWFSVAAAGGDADSAKKRDEVAARMDAAGLEAAKSAAATFSAKPTVAAANEVKAPSGGWDMVAPRAPASATPLAPSGNAHLSRL